MDLATQELIERLHELGPEGRARLGEDQLAEIEVLLAAAKYDKLDALCGQEVASFEAGPLLWLTQYTKTENPQYEQQTKDLGRPVPFLAGFPRKEYFIHLFRAFLAREPQLYVAKSRTMMTSFSAAGFAAWAAQWKGEETLIQTLNEDKAMHLVDYVKQLMDHQEPWLSDRHPIAKQSVFAISWKGGGEVAAIPGGANAVRAYHSTTYLQDESAYMVEGEEALNAVVPTGARIICISTAGPGWFADACAR